MNTNQVTPPKLLNYHTPESLELIFEDEKKKIAHLIEEYNQKENNENNCNIDTIIYNWFLELLRKYSVKSQNKFFLNQLYGTNDPLLAEIDSLATIYNISPYTYEVAPLATIMERDLRKSLNNLFDLGASGDFIINPGGSYSNMIAIGMARDYYYPHLQIGDQPLKIFISEQAHYSFEKITKFLGIGECNLIKIPILNDGSMNVDELDRQIHLSHMDCIMSKIIIVATLGTTSFGVHDNLEKIAQISKKYGAWLHLDACFGGCLVYKQDLDIQRLLVGLNYVNTISWNPHKALGFPLQSSLLMVKDSKYFDIFRLKGTKDAYLFDNDRYYSDEYDNGKKYLQCGRRNDVYKLWIGLKLLKERNIFRTKTFVHHLDYLENVTLNQNLIGFRMQPKSLAFLVWYIPDKWNTITLEGDPQSRIALKHHLSNYLGENSRGISSFWKSLPEEMCNDIDQITNKIKEKMMQEGIMMISSVSTTHQGFKLPRFFRIIPFNPELSQCDIDLILQKIVEYGKELE